MRALLFAVFVVPFCSSVVQGDLILQINTTDKTFAFTGDATGMPLNFGVGITLWQATGIGGAPNSPNVFTYDNDVAFSTNVGTPGAGGLDTQFAVSSGVGGSLDITLRTSSGTNQTLTGTEVFQSYASLGAGSLAMFESSIGQTASLLGGTGFGDLSIQAASTASAVPEPSSFVLLSLSVAGFSLLHRRRKLKKLEVEEAGS